LNTQDGGRSRDEARFAHPMPFGAELLPNGRGTRFRLWAPSALRVELQLLGAEVGPGGAGAPGADRSSVQPLRAAADGWHAADVPEAVAGTRYKFLVHRRDAEPISVPDPASRSNPDGVHGPSSVVDPRSYPWRERAWPGRPWEQAVVYELHIGTFTPEGTFAAAAGRLPELAALGVTALQIMPLAAFPGARNWGYDGVLAFAPAPCYGSPDELKSFIDAAHSHGLMMLLDVVYNHFGPDGNYLHAYCPEFFNPAHRTPWGAAINFDGESNRPVRDFFIHNALYWLQEHRFDGLRLDAVHAIRDATRPDIVCELARVVREGPGIERHIHIMLENNRNEPHYLERDPRGRPIWATAQWDDDVHHALHATVSGEADGYYADYAATPLEHLGRALTEGFAYQGEHSAFRGRARGARSEHLPPSAFVGFLQNHDMVGNRAFGDRIQHFADARLLTAAYACLLLTPQVPMLFMGEEFAASTPFLFFCDFGPELARAVTQGRRREFKRFAAFADDAAVAAIPDPGSASTFDASKLRWTERTQAPQRERLALITELLDLRRRYLMPQLEHVGRGSFRVEGSLLHLEWRLSDTTRWRVLANFAGNDATASRPQGEIVFAAGVRQESAAMCMSPGAVLVVHGPRSER
jgi:maltooligosyltrehalose trehalohydrolase